MLKWAKNNKNSSKLNGSKSKDEKKWLHSPETLVQGHVVYLVKVHSNNFFANEAFVNLSLFALQFLGNTEVDQPKGIDVVKQGIQKLKFNQQLKKSDGGNTKTPKVELTISVDGVAIQEPKTKKMMHQYPLHKISYCADDKAEKRFFSFIAKEGDSNQHMCFVFVSDKLVPQSCVHLLNGKTLILANFLLSRPRRSR